MTQAGKSRNPVPLAIPKREYVDADEDHSIHVLVPSLTLRVKICLYSLYHDTFAMSGEIDG